MQNTNRKLCFTERQLNQLETITENLRRLNRTVLRQLRHNTCCGLIDKRRNELAESLVIVAIRINALMQVREQIVKDARKQMPQLFIIILGLTCNNCRGKELNNPDEADSSEPLKYDPGWETEVDELLDIVGWVSEASMSRGKSAKSFFVALSRFSNALLRQKRHLRETAPEQEMKVEMKYDDSGICPDCHQPIEGFVKADDSDDSRRPEETNALSRAMKERSHDQQ